MQLFAETVGDNQLQTPIYSIRHLIDSDQRSLQTVERKVAYCSDSLVDLPLVVLVVDVNNLKNGRKPVKLQKESSRGCAGEGKQSKGN